jgi:L-iditol 2-dehydrogenase
VSELAVGKCGICAMCRTGRYQFCDRKRPPGWASQGVYVESIVVPADLVHKVPRAVSFEVAALAEPVAVCVYGCLERGGIRPRDSTVIFGAGSLGLLTLIVLKDAGIKHVVCVGPATKGRRRLDLARELGASTVLTPEDDVADALKRITGRDRADAGIDCSGAAQAINQGLRLLRKDGTFVALGIAPDSTIPIAFNTGVLNALRIVFSCTSSHSAWQHTVPLLKRRQAALAQLITHRLPLSEWKKAFAALEEREAVKVVLYT